jgi:quinol monooxygenase YgiN
MYTLLVIMRFKTEKAKAAWCDSLKILGKYVLEHEPNTLQYLFSESVEDPLVITIFETYKSKSDLHDVQYTKNRRPSWSTLLE